jgi:hypothetical protein
MSESRWTETRHNPPPENRVVQTLICHGPDITHETLLMRQGTFWFVPDRSMRVYYTPTYWREIV